MFQYKIGEFSKITGIPIVTLKRWDNSGKLPAMHSPSGYRYYTDADVELAKVLRERKSK